MKSCKLWCFGAFLLSVISTVPVVADIYRFKSVDGVEIFTDKPPKGTHFELVLPKKRNKDSAKNPSVSEEKNENVSQFSVTVTPPTPEKPKENGFMFYYLLGVAIASLINMVRLFIGIVTGFSQRIKNIKKIGGHFNITVGQVTKDKPSFAKVAFYIADILIITPLLSWLYVCYFIFAVIKGRINRVPVPEKIKEINFKLSTANLPKEAVKQCLNEISRFYHGQDIDFRMPYDDDDWKDYYSIKSGSGRHDWNVHLDLDKSNNTFTITARDPDFGEHIDVYEYKFEGYDLWARTIESKCKYPDHTEYMIKDGKVLEHEYRDRHEIGSCPSNSPEGVEERVQKLYADLEWNNYNHPVVKYFIFFRHEDLFDDATAKKHLQSEYNRITSGYKRLEEKVNSLGCSIGEEEYSLGNTIKCNKDTPPENRDEAHEILYNNGFQRFDICYGEFNQYPQLVEDLKRYISKL